jgi:hypothetical protein
MAHSLSVLIRFSLIPTITAFPITYHSHRVRLSKRGLPAGAGFGIGFAIALCIIATISLIYYFKVHRRRPGTKSRKGQSTLKSYSTAKSYPTTISGTTIHTRSPTILSDKLSIADSDRFKTRISCPMPMHSTALPSFSPVEPGSSPKFEVDEKLTHDRPTLHELDASPRMPPHVHPACRPASLEKPGRRTRCRSLSRSKAHAHRRLTSAISARTLRKSFHRRSYFPFGNRRGSIFDRGSWFGCQGAMDIEGGVRHGRETSVETLPAYPGPAMLRENSENTAREWALRDTEDCLEGKSLCGDEGEWLCGDRSMVREKGERVPTMDWSGMEWLRGMYAERRSMLRSFCPRDE